jgi:predicted nucleotidyltransferase
MKFGLKEKTITDINHVFKKYPQISNAILYGSRAKGNYRPNSDIDLSLKGENLDLTLLLKVENELDDLLLPYKVDLTIYHRLENPDLVAHIDRVGLMFYDKR